MSLLAATATSVAIFTSEHQRYDVSVQTHLVIPPRAPVLRSNTKAFVSNTPSSVTGKRTLELPIRIDKIKRSGGNSVSLAH